MKATARSKLTAKFLEALQADFEQHGAGVIEKLREENPARYAEVVARLCPVEASVTQDSEYTRMAEMTEDERLDYLLDATENYLAGLDEVRLSKEKRERIRSFRALAYGEEQ
jgi:hypothetical protein